ncbi:unnamed protein product [Moneuplotes crassus]|uniref:Uncharacterized protein n=1 Tax=Euplotes crassus TaxID=5936 RepID=A0AAD1U4N2_EUPCR|nr:unnamed protein product [Moneuplotes crassus]
MKRNESKPSEFISHMQQWLKKADAEVLTSQIREEKLKKVIPDYSKRNLKIKRKSNCSTDTQNNPLFYSLKDIPERGKKKMRITQPIFHSKKKFSNLMSKRNSMASSKMPKETTTVITDDVIDSSNFMTPVGIFEPNSQIWNMQKTDHFRNVHTSNSIPKYALQPPQNPDLPTSSLLTNQALQTTLTNYPSLTFAKPRVCFSQKVPRSKSQKTLSRLEAKETEHKFIKNKNIITRMVNRTFMKLKRQQELESMRKRVQTQRQINRESMMRANGGWENGGYSRLLQSKLYKIDSRAFVNGDGLSDTPGVEIFDNQEIRKASTHASCVVSHDNSPTRINGVLDNKTSFHPDNLKNKLEIIQKVKDKAKEEIKKDKILVKVKSDAKIEGSIMPHKNICTSPVSQQSTNTLNSMKNSFTLKRNLKTSRESHHSKSSLQNPLSSTDALKNKTFNKTTKAEITAMLAARNRPRNESLIPSQKDIISSTGIASTESNFPLTKGKYNFGKKLKKLGSSPKKVPLTQRVQKVNRPPDFLKKQALISQCDFNFGQIPIEMTPAMKIQLDELKEKILEDNPNPPPFKL